MSLDSVDPAWLDASVLRARFRSVAKRLHDRLFRNHVYVVRHGFMRGHKRRGRMPWFQRPRPQEARELEFFENLDLAGKVAYDIGANIGMHSVKLGEKVGPSGRVIAFEPDPIAAEKLRDVIGLNQLSHVDVHQVALGRETGRLSLLVPDSTRVHMSATLSPSLKAQAAPEHVKRSVMVEVVRLDDYVRERALPAPDFLKIDVEGFEVEMLEGAAETIAQSKPTIFVEVHGAGVAEKERIARDVFKSLPGYAFLHLETGTRTRGTEPTTEPSQKLPLGGHWICTSSTNVPGR
ncbi:MAG: FkbM family methyltransferase [Deltaproteobacteria bacterium]|nr:FkbM family methyltransferase [Deltaproteobacteria bacterium]